MSGPPALQVVQSWVGLDNSVACHSHHSLSTEITLSTVGIFSSTVYLNFFFSTSRQTWTLWMRTWICEGWFHHSPIFNHIWWISKTELDTFNNVVHNIVEVVRFQDVQCPEVTRPPLESNTGNWQRESHLMFNNMARNLHYNFKSCNFDKPDYIKLNSLHITTIQYCQFPILIKLTRSDLDKSLEDQKLK